MSSGTELRDPATRLDRAAATVAVRLAAAVAHRAGDSDESVLLLCAAADDLQAARDDQSPPDEVVAAVGGASVPPVPGAIHPIDRLVTALDLSALDLDLLLLTCLSDAHEAAAAALRRLHPLGRPFATAGLAALLAEQPAEDLSALGPAAHHRERHAVRSRLRSGPLTRWLLLRGDDSDAPFWERSLRPAEGLWDLLSGDLHVWPTGWQGAASCPAPEGSLLRPWLGDDRVEAARRAIEAGAPVTVSAATVHSSDAVLLAQALVTSCRRRPLTLCRDESVEGVRPETASLWAAVGGHVAILTESPAGCGPWARSAVDRLPMGWPTVVVSTVGVPCPTVGTSALVGLELTTPGPGRRDDWRDELPELAGAVPVSRSDLSDSDRAEAALDARTVARWARRGVEPDDVLHAVRTRHADPIPRGARHVRPVATWDDLVVGPAQEQRLRELAARVDHADVVLDEWGLLRSSRGRRGIRVLLPGPPGTGKTLTAEVLAGQWRRELLVVDLASVLSKWVGETEQHLAALFDSADRSGAVLFFDEADALFGRRTEIGDARDRYANLETAYLLGRIETFDGITILATNLRQNLDSALIRRFDAVIPFSAPGIDERAALWRRQLPDRVPRSPSVDLELLARRYPITGAQIRSAAIAAAYLAAADGGLLRPDHLDAALRREYEKSGQAFPDLGLQGVRP